MILLLKISQNAFISLDYYVINVILIFYN